MSCWRMVLVVFVVMSLLRAAVADESATPSSSAAAGRTLDQLWSEFGRSTQRP